MNAGTNKISKGIDSSLAEYAEKELDLRQEAKANLKNWLNQNGVEEEIAEYYYANLSICLDHYISKMLSLDIDPCRLSYQLKTINDGPLFIVSQYYHSHHSGEDSYYLNTIHYVQDEEQKEDSYIISFKAISYNYNSMTMIPNPYHANEIVEEKVNKITYKEYE